MNALFSKCLRLTALPEARKCSVGYLGWLLPAGCSATGGVPAAVNLLRLSSSPQKYTNSSSTRRKNTSSTSMRLPVGISGNWLGKQIVEVDERTRAADLILLGVRCSYWTSNSLVHLQTGG